MEIGTMLGSGYAAILLLLLVAMLSSMAQMGAALAEEDIESFSLWTGVAATIALLPTIF